LLISEKRLSTALSLLNVARELHIMTNEIEALIAECEKRMRETKEKDPKILRHSESAEAERIQGVEDSKEKGPSEKDSSNNDMSIAPSPSFPLVGNLSDSPLEKGETGGYSKEGFRPLQKNGGQASRNDKKEDLDSALFKHSDPRILESSIPAFSDTGTLEPLTPGTLALCMIVKNEEDNIRRALESVKPVVDEMIVVDTGSTDRTKDIAKEMGAKVYDFVWTDSFADARNFALSKATSKWILILDADEVISPDDHDKLRELIEKDSRIQGVK
jgi:hypothetical protein